MNRNTISRRNFLRGAAGATLALPMLEFLQPRNAIARQGAACPRMLVYYLPNGRRPEWWVPTAGAEGLVFPTESAALQPFADRALSVSNLDNIAARMGPGAAHAMGTGTVLTGRLIPDLTGIANDISIDQIIANATSRAHRFASLQWSAGRIGVCDVGGSPCAYTQSSAWAGPGQPLYPELSPARAFDRLFRTASDGLAGAAGATRERSVGSILDYVSEDASALQGRLGASDRHRLDEYFESLFALEQSLFGDVADCSVPVPPEADLAYPERVTAFHELIRLALQCDQTRVISFMIELGLSYRSHDFINAPGGHHSLSHGDFNLLRLVEQWQAQQLGSLLSLLDTTPGIEGGSLLDETLVLAMPSMGEGASHDHTRVCPLLIGGGGAIQTGQAIDAAGTSLTHFHVGLLDAYGIEGDFGGEGVRFGDDGTAAIPGIAA